MSLKFVLKGPMDNNPPLILNNGLAPNRWKATIWTNADPINFRIYAPQPPHPPPSPKWFVFGIKWKVNVI